MLRSNRWYVYGKQDKMPKRFVAIWFRHLITDWFVIRRPALAGKPFVLAAPDHGRMVVTAASAAAQAQGINAGAVVADARAIIPGLEVYDDKAGLSRQLLKIIGKWCIRYTPAVAIDEPDGLLLDASGCTHLWGGEQPYLEDIVARLRNYGYDVRAAMAGTIGAAWAISRFGEHRAIISNGAQSDALLPLPPAALRLESGILERLHKLGLYKISSFIGMPRPALRRRFGGELLLRLDQALGQEEEVIQPLEPVQPYLERLPCLEPILTATGITIALERLLDQLCNRLRQEGKGLRTAIFKCFRIDGKTVQAEIGTNRASQNAAHLFSLFSDKISSIEPALGIEVFVLEAPKVEEMSAPQETLWAGGCSVDSIRLSELIDRLAGRVGSQAIRRYLPAQHYWPERSVKPASSLHEQPDTTWRDDRPRPVRLLQEPEPITVAAPIPDYPPMLFRYKGKLHRIKKADGPERVACEWWHEEKQHRDYYIVEDEDGYRYWLFRSGHYTGDKTHQWFIHGFFA